MLDRSDVLAALALLPLSGSALLAQSYATERHRLLPSNAPSTVASSAVSGDFDQDGDIDLAIAVRFGELTIAWNDGEGRFTAGPTFPVAGETVVAGDIDGDGDLDLAVGGALFFTYFAPSTLLRNDGAAGFVNVTATQWPTTSEAPSKIVFLDWDLDGDLDLLTCNSFVGQQVGPGQQPINRLYLNDGAGFFTDVTAARMPNTTQFNSSVVVGDIDGDGDPDLLFASRQTSSSAIGSVRVFLHNAQGVAVETPGRVPVPPGFYTTYQDLVLSDHDLDGDLDLAVCSSQGVYLFTNNGLGFFSLAGTLPDPMVWRWQAGDIDGDGRIDLLAARRDSYHYRALPLRLYRNTLAGFVDATAAWIEDPEIAPSALHRFDCDGDGDLDLWGAVSPQAVLWHNDGQGRLRQIALSELSNTNTIFAVVADVDGDGDRDAAIVEGTWLPATSVSFVRNDGYGPGPAPVVLVPLELSPRPRCLSFLDVDLDGDLDLFVGNQGGGGVNGQDMLFHNVAGVFVDVTATHMPVGGGTKTVVQGDVDGDGIADLVAPGFLGAKFYRGDGVGGFVDASSVLPPTTTPVFGVALIDYDQDGDLDIALSLASWAPPPPDSLRLLRNDWPGPFVDVTSSLTLPPLEAWSVATIDIDRDGRMDLLVGNNVVVGSNGLVLLRSVGTGFVDETVLRVPPMYTSGSIAVVDLDGDGWHDVVLRNQNEGYPQELRNTNGVLAAFPNLAAFFSGALPAHPAAADLDGDGDQDLVHTFGTLRNRVRDLQNAVPPRLGLHGELVLHAHDGDGVNVQFASLLVSALRANPPLSLPGFGTLRLDPATAAFHSVHAMAPSGGEAAVGYFVPALPALLGSSFFAQALFVHQPSPSTWRLGNLVELRVRL